MTDLYILYSTISNYSLLGKDDMTEHKNTPQSFVFAALDKANGAIDAPNLIKMFPNIKPNTILKAKSRWWKRHCDMLPDEPDPPETPSDPGSPPAGDHSKKQEITTEYLEQELIRNYKRSDGKLKIDLLRFMVDVWKSKHTVPDTKESDDMIQLIEALKNDRLPETGKMA